MNYRERVQLFFIHPQVTHKLSQNQVKSQMSLWSFVMHVSTEY